jgi:hypothetical protein
VDEKDDTDTYDDTGDDVRRRQTCMQKAERAESGERKREREDKAERRWRIESKERAENIKQREG